VNCRLVAEPVDCRVTQVLARRARTNVAATATEAVQGLLVKRRSMANRETDKTAKPVRLDVSQTRRVSTERRAAAPIR
jgi:hypothetical protein